MRLIDADALIKFIDPEHLRHPDGFDVDRANHRAVGDV